MTCLVRFARAGTPSLNAPFPTLSKKLTTSSFSSLGSCGRRRASVTTTSFTNSSQALTQRRKVLLGLASTSAATHVSLWPHSLRRAIPAVGHRAVQLPQPERLHVGANDQRCGGLQPREGTTQQRMHSAVVFLSSLSLSLSRSLYSFLVSNAVDRSSKPCWRWTCRPKSKTTCSRFFRVLCDWATSNSRARRCPRCPTPRVRILPSPTCYYARSLCRDDSQSWRLLDNC